MKFVYEFEDGEVYTLIDKGFSLGDIMKLEEMHGKEIHNNNLEGDDESKRFN